MNDVPSFVWSQADSRAIAYDPDAGAWHAGIVKDILVTTGGAVLVAAATGGIWSVSDTGVGICLIDSDQPDMWCLAQGPLADSHAFAGGQTLFETDVSQALPLLSWNDLAPADAKGNSVGTVYRIVVLAPQRRIVIATDNGVFWSDIPPLATAGCLGGMLGLGGGTRSPFVWTAATGLPAGTFGSLVAGPAGQHELATIVTAAWGDNDPKGTLHGLFVGDWGTGGNLDFERVKNLGGVDPTTMCFTVVAAHADNPAKMYSSASDSSGNLVALLDSEDGGHNWTALPGKLTNPQTGRVTVFDACHGQGNDGGRPCNALGAAPSRQGGRVALGWRAGPLLSTDGGQTFTELSPQTIPQLHSDLHCLHFDGNSRLFVGSDGGVAMTADYGQSFDSTYSQSLLNLQFLGTTGIREWYGCLGLSPDNPGVVGTGTQDNGNLISDLTTGNGWTFVEGGDGRIVSFLANNSIFHYWGDDGRGQLAVWDGSQEQQRGVIPYYQQRVLENPVFERVEQPGWRDPDGRLMYGVAGVDDNVYGLTADKDASNTAWRYIAGLPIELDTVSAVSSRGGYLVMVGTWGGRMFTVDPANDLNVVQMPVDPLAGKKSDPDRVVARIVIANDALAFASYNRTDGSSGSVLRWNGRSWSTVAGGFPNEIIYAMEIDVVDGDPVVYLATDAKVWGSADLGSTWVDASSGLPRRPHGSDLRLTQDGDGTHLYLSTFGRSLWRGDPVTAIHVQPR